MKSKLFFIVLTLMCINDVCIAQNKKLPAYFLCNTQVEYKGEISVKLIHDIGDNKCKGLMIFDTLRNEVEIKNFVFVHSKNFKNDRVDKIRKNQYLVENVKNNILSKKFRRRLKKAKVGDYITIASVECIIYGKEKMLNGLTIRIIE